MSLTKKRRLGGPLSHRRDSFTNRICDDLWPELLQYLSLEDKYRLECVSKHFQKTVFVKQLGLSPLPYLCYNGLQEKKDRDFDLRSFEEKFEKLLKKCPNIRSIDFTHFLNWFSNDGQKSVTKQAYNRMIELIVENCNNLTEIRRIDLKLLNEKTFNEFVAKFGSKVVLSLQLLPRNASLYQSFSGLVLENRYSLRKLNQIMSKNVNNVKKTSLELYPKEIEEYKGLLSNAKTLTHLWIKKSDLNDADFTVFLRHISSLTELVELEFHWKIDINNSLFVDLFEQIGKKCPKIKSIKCGFGINSDPKSADFLAPFKAFKGLKRLDLTLFEHFTCRHSRKELSLKAFRGLENITHLTLHFTIKSDGFTGRNHVGYHIFSGIANSLPKLKYLKVVNTLEPYSSPPIHLFTGLLRLETLELNVFDQHIETWKQLKRKCRKLNTLVLGDYTY